MDQQFASQLPPKPDNCLVWAILTTVCCGCLPCGIVAIVYAAQVDGKYAAGDYQGAVDSANKAKTWCWVSFGIGIVVTVLSFFFGFFAELFAQSQSNQYYY
jgi:hypothetical protein